MAERLVGAPCGSCVASVWFGQSGASVAVCHWAVKVEMSAFSINLDCARWCGEMRTLPSDSLYELLAVTMLYRAAVTPRRSYG
jgi:hypothetical protein